MNKAIPGLVAVLLAAGLLVAACGDDEEEEAPPAATSAPSGAVEIGADDFYFEPAQLAAQAGETVTVRVANEGAAPHTFTIDELNVDQVLNPGQEATVTFTPSQAGTLAFYCRFHRGQGMEGSLTVSGGSGGAAPEQATPAPDSTTPVPGYGY